MNCFHEVNSTRVALNFSIHLAGSIIIYYELSKGVYDSIEAVAVRVSTAT